MKQTSFISPAGSTFLNGQIESCSPQNLCKNMINCDYVCCQERNERIIHPQYILKTRNKKTFNTFASGPRKESLRLKKYSRNKAIALNKSLQDHKICIQSAKKKYLNRSHQVMLQSQVYTGSPNSFNSNQSKCKKNTIENLNNSLTPKISHKYKLSKFIPQIYSESSSSNIEYPIIQQKMHTPIRSLVNESCDQKSKRARESQEFSFINNQQYNSSKLEKKPQSLRNLTKIKFTDKTFRKNHSQSYMRSFKNGLKLSIGQPICKINEASKIEEDDQSYLKQKKEQIDYCPSSNFYKSKDTQNNKNQAVLSNGNLSMYKNQTTQQISHLNIKNDNSVLTSKNWQNLGDKLIINETKSTATDNIQSTFYKSVSTTENKLHSHIIPIEQNQKMQIKSIKYACVSSPGSHSNTASFKNSIGSSFPDMSCRSKIKSIANISDSNFEINKISKPMSAHYFQNQIQSINELVPYYVQSIATSKNQNNEDKQFSQVLINYLRKTNSPPLINLQKKDSTGSITFSMQQILKNQGQNKQFFYRNMQKGKGILFIPTKVSNLSK